MRQLRKPAARRPPAKPQNDQPPTWSELTTPLGQLFIATNQQGLCAIKFGRLETNGKSREPQAASATLPKQASAQLKEFFAGQRHDFNLPLDISLLTPFQREVLAVTSRIPWGKVWTYRRVAEEIGQPNASRAVGQALGRNPIPIVIPCHRVIASDGGLGGYCGTTGLDLKRWLLRHEGVWL